MTSHDMEAQTHVFKRVGTLALRADLCRPDTAARRAPRPALAPLRTHLGTTAT